MSTLTIADAIGTVREEADTDRITSVGATLFVKPRLSEAEKERVHEALAPKRIYDPDKKLTKIDL